MENRRKRLQTFLLVGLGALAVWSALKAVRRSQDMLPSSPKVGFEGPLHIGASQFKLPQPAAPRWGSFSVAGDKKAEEKKGATVKEVPPQKVAQTPQHDKKKKDKKKTKKKAARKAFGAVAAKGYDGKREPRTINERDFENGLGGFGAGRPPTQSPAQTNPEDPSSFLSLEDWDNFLFSNPDLKKGLKLLEAFQAGQLKDPSWFHTLVEKMVLDSRTNLKEIGFYLLGAVPSYPSFSILAAHYNEFGPDFTEKNEKRLWVYGHQRFLWPVLGGALRSGEPSQQIAAAKVVAATAPFLRSSGTSRQGRGTNVGTSGVFALLRPVLENVADSDPNADVRGSASEAIRVLDSLNRQLTQL